MCREVLQIHGWAADVGILYNKVLIVEDRNINCRYVLYEARGSAVGRGTALQAGRSWV